MESGLNTLARKKYQMLGREYSFGNIKNIEKDELEPYVQYAEKMGLIAKILN